MRCFGLLWFVMVCCCLLLFVGGGRCFGGVLVLFDCVWWCFLCFSLSCLSFRFVLWYVVVVCVAFVDAVGVVVCCCYGFPLYAAMV